MLAVFMMDFRLQAAGSRYVCDREEADEQRPLNDEIPVLACT
jgi:hypothetical protein